MTAVERARRTATRLSLLVLLAGTSAAGLGSPGAAATLADTGVAGTTLAGTGVPGRGSTGAAAATAGAVRSAQPAWSVQPTPRIPVLSGGLNSVSCTSGTFCAALGQPSYAGPLAATWNGTTWQKQSLSGLKIEPRDVSCVSPAFCVAVGARPAGGPMIATWNGTSWAAQTSPKYNGSFLGVSCSSDTACLAVGLVAKTGSYFPYAEQWNGTQWLPVTVSHSGYLNGYLDAVSCPSATACTAVGYYRSSGSADFSLLIDRWNGTSMTVQPSAQPPSASEGTLTGVSCPQINGCVAVGYVGNAPVAQVWDGAAWTAMSPPAITGTVNSVSCTAVTACSAVGQISGKSGRSHLLAEQLTGTTWSVQQIPAPTGSGSDLLDVSCVQATDCTAVGIYTSTSLRYRSLAEAWNGSTWTIRSAPNGTDTQPVGSFSGVSCPQPAQCAAVGNFYTGAGRLPLAETWDGSRWALSSPPPAEPVTHPAGISCPATTMCMAVGTYTSARDRTSPWAELWDGGRWTSVNPPEPSARHAFPVLSGVSCASATSCVAVGDSSTPNTANTPLAYAWNGSQWTQQQISASGRAVLSGVSCTSADSCIAVGHGKLAWLAEAWNGQSWTQLATSGTPVINAVSCSSATGCTAVGTSSSGGHAVIERWDGTSWTAQQAASAPSGFDLAQLYGVSCASATACTAVGYYANSKAGTSTNVFIQSWDGTSWTAVPAPATGNGYLSSISCTAPSACIAAGVRNPSTTSQEPLAETSG